MQRSNSVRQCQNDRDNQSDQRGRVLLSQHNESLWKDVYRPLLYESIDYPVMQITQLFMRFRRFELRMMFNRNVALTIRRNLACLYRWTPVKISQPHPKRVNNFVFTTRWR